MSAQNAHMIINAESQANDIERDFTDHFPYLRLKFIKTDTLKRINAINKGIANKPSCIQEGNCNGACSQKLIIVETMTVAELETAFNHYFGAQVEVLRKSGNVWLKINFTNNWTLQQQNQMGEQIS